MLTTYNIDRTDSELNTNFPFQWQCKLQLGPVAIPSGSFLSVRIYCTEGIRPPVRLHRVKVSGTEGTVEFRDAQGVVIGYWYFGERSAGQKVSAFIVNAYNVISGHVVCSAELPVFLFSVVKNNNGEIITDSDDFQLLPQCHVSSLTGHSKAFKIGAEVFNEDITIESGSYTSSTFESNTYSISLMSKYSGDELSISRDGLLNLVVDGNTYYIGGRHLILRSGLASNLRVCMKNSNITLKGVLDD